MSQSLTGKVAIITGASSGIGAATARLLSQQGCKLTLAARSYEKLAALAAELPCDCLALRADMTQPADISNMIERTLERFGAVDIMFANAGVWMRGQFAAGDLDDFSALLKINIDAVLRCAQAVIPGMKARGSGDIIVTSSISGHHDLHAEPVYSASKNAVQTIVHTLRRQLEPAGIRVMSLAPGPVANPMQGLHDPEEIRRVTEDDRDYLSSDDCAEAILFMLSRPPHVTIRDLVMLPQIDRV